jgi:KRAB domain-containing zinc finger protein
MNRQQETMSSFLGFPGLLLVSNVIGTF